MMKPIDSGIAQFEKLKQLFKDNSYESIRDPANYDVVELDYPFGKRLSYRPRQQGQVSDLNALRGLRINQQQETIADVGVIEASMEFLQNDLIRMKELEDFGVLSQQHDQFLEFGFRSSKLLEYYKSTNLFKRVWGVDVVDVNVAAAQNMGYDVQLCDLNTIQESDVDFSGVTLCVSYHCFEHLYDPLATIKEIVRRLDDGCIMHFEIPVEGHALPRIRYGHLYSFERHDLTKMLQISNAKILHTEMTYDIERIIAKK